MGSPWFWVFELVWVVGFFGFCERGRFFRAGRRGRATAIDSHLNGQHAAVGQGVLEPLGRLERAVAQLPVERQGNAEAARQEVGPEEQGHVCP
jgi:hypothetical protein